MLRSTTLGAGTVFLDTGLRVLHFDVRQAGLDCLNAVLAFVDLSSDTIKLILGQNHADSDVQLTSLVLLINTPTAWYTIIKIISSNIR